MKIGADKGIPLNQEDTLIYARSLYKFFSSPTLTDTNWSITCISP